MHFSIYAFSISSFSNSFACLFSLASQNLHLHLISLNSNFRLLYQQRHKSSYVTSQILNLPRIPKDHRTSAFYRYIDLNVGLTQIINKQYFLTCHVPLNCTAVTAITTHSLWKNIHSKYTTTYSKIIQQSHWVINQSNQQDQRILW
jgi:hypothetical protein